MRRDKSLTTKTKPTALSSSPSTLVVTLLSAPREAPAALLSPAAPVVVFLARFDVAGASAAARFVPATFGVVVALDALAALGAAFGARFVTALVLLALAAAAAAFVAAARFGREVVDISARPIETKR